MIAVRGLAHRYGDAVALRVPEWRVQAGERWLVLGPSGSGKTTLLHVIAGLIRPSEGDVEVAGEKLTALDATQIDRWRGTAPWGLLAGLVLGVIVGFYELIKSVLRK